MITTGNRQQFIADGLHYELVSTLAQETAQEMMRRTFHLEWITICDDDAFGEHVRNLVDHDHRLILEDSENRLAVEELLGVHFQQHTLTTSREDEKKEDSPLKLTCDQIKQINSAHCYWTRQGSCWYLLKTAPIDLGGRSWHGVA